MNFRLTLPALLLAGSLTAAAEDDSTLPLDAWRRVQVQENGRVQPLDTYARNLLLTFSGRSTYERAPAALWLARVFFTPEETRADELFLVNHPEVLEALGLEARERGRFSFEQLAPTFNELNRLARAAMAIEAKQRTPVDGELLRLFSNLQTYDRLTDAFIWAEPRTELVVRDPQLRQELGLPENTAPTALDLITRMDQLDHKRAQQRDVAEADRTPYQQEVERMGTVAHTLAHRLGRMPPSLLPSTNPADPAWLSPSEALHGGAITGAPARDLALLAEAATAYRGADGERFERALGDFNTAIAARSASGAARIGIEVFTNRLDPFYRAELLYGGAFLLALGSVAMRPRLLRITAAVLVLMALVLHTYGIGARMFIMHRPPVTNLYTTFVFVSWVCAWLGLALEWLQRNRLGLILSAASGLALLMTAARFADGNDTMGVMVAVLDSNFWLATHVVTISIGYAGCCAAGLLGHVYLLQALRRPAGDPVLRETFGAVYGLQAFGLVFAFVGTMLGGVWADQSWGRFWGWDPKENGALVIVLWSATLFHARMARMIGPLGFAAGSVLGVIAVLLAWLGVNLLGVGLHSYGFTSGVARGLFLSCALEIAFVAILTPLARRTPARTAPMAHPEGAL